MANCKIKAPFFEIGALILPEKIIGAVDIIGKIRLAEPAKEGRVVRVQRQFRRKIVNLRIAPLPVFARRAANANENFVRRFPGEERFERLFKRSGY